MKLWEGGLHKDHGWNATEPFVKRDIDAERQLLKYEILSLIAYHLDLYEKRAIDRDESICIIHTLLYILRDPPSITIDYEDAHTVVENAVEDRCGKLGHNLRLYLSRNEQVHNNVLMFTIERTAKIVSDMLQCIKVLENLETDALLPGSTHFMPAMPISARTYLNYIEESLAFHIKAIDHSVSIVSDLAYGYGSGYGSPFSGSLYTMAVMLGLGQPHKNPMFAASLYQYVFTSVANSITQTAVFISRIAMDLIDYYRMGYVALPDAFTTGSSLMPNKRNPDYLELLQGIASLSMSNAVMIWSTFLNKTSGYHRDFQIMKDSFVEFIDYFSDALSHFKTLIENIRFISNIQKLPDEIFATGNAWNAFKMKHDWRESYIDIGKMLKDGANIKPYEPENYIDVVEMQDLETIAEKYSDILKKWDNLIEKAEKFAEGISGNAEYKGP